MNHRARTGGLPHPAFDDEDELAACAAAVQECLQAMAVALSPKDEPFPLPSLPIRTPA